MGNNVKSLCLFAHFDKNNRIAPYVVEYLRGLQPLVSTIIFISTSQLPQDEKQKIASFVLEIITKPNIGYDFMSWQTGLKHIQNYKEYDEIIIANDSCYAPLFPFEEMFLKMRAKTCDFWGNTESNDIAYHFQSYFLVFNKNIILSRTFADFWENIEPQGTKYDVVEKYEIGLSKLLIANRFKGQAYCSKEPELQDNKNYLNTLLFVRQLKYKIQLALKSPKKIISYLLNPAKFIKNWVPLDELNPSMFLYNENLKMRSPFIKTHLFRDNIINKNSYFSSLQETSTYDVHLIKENIQRNL